MQVADSYGNPLVCSDLSLNPAHFVALRSDGTLAIHGPIATWHRPTEFSALATSVLEPYSNENFLSEIKKISTGHSHLAAITRSGFLHTAGSDEFGQLCSTAFQYRNPEKGYTLDEPVKEVACGDHHTVLLRPDGRIKTGGRNHRGQLGRDVPVGSGHDWLYFMGEDRVTRHRWFGNCDFVPGIDDATAIYAGGDSTIIVRKSGITVCGDNEFGQLGTATEKHVVNADDRPAWIESGVRNHPFQTNLMPPKQLEEIFGR
jgi:alpha-tubulin suppressor-like RCC1 family protein